MADHQQGLLGLLLTPLLLVMSWVPGEMATGPSMFFSAQGEEDIGPFVMGAKLRNCSYTVLGSSHSS